MDNKNYKYIFYSKNIKHIPKYVFKNWVYLEYKLKVNVTHFIFHNWNHVLNVWVHYVFGTEIKLTTVEKSC